MILKATKSTAPSRVVRSGRLFVLELSGDRIHSMNPDGSDREARANPNGWPVESTVPERAWLQRSRLQPRMASIPNEVIHERTIGRDPA